MATFGELRQQASRRLKDVDGTAVPYTIVEDAINSALKYWKQQRFYFNEFGETVTLVAGDPVLPTLTDILYLFPRYGMTISYQNYDYNLRKVSPDVYNWGNNQMSGRPTVYTWSNGQYLLYGYPDQAYTVNLSGVRDYDELVNANDTNDFTEEADQLLLYDALSRMTAELRTDPTISDYYTKRAQDEAANLRKRTNKMAGTGRLKVQGINYRYAPDIDYYYY